MSAAEVATRRRCSRCGETKPTDDFYPVKSGADGLMPYCKKCDNGRPRKANDAKINRMRARHRAVADLIQFHKDEYDALLAIRLAEAQSEAETLAATPAAAEHFAGEPVRLKPGKRMPGEKAGDRIDVARCPHCIKHHDMGHVCKRCGSAPVGALRLPDDEHMDEIAIERAERGDAVRLTRTERAEVVRRLASRGESDATIATRLHTTGRTVWRIRQESAIESRWSA